LQQQCIFDSLSEMTSQPSPDSAPPAGEPPLRLDPYAWDFHEAPYPLYARLRNEAPAYRNDELGFWALTRHEDVERALKDHATYSNSEGVALEAFSPEAWRVMFFLAMDPPRHNHLRGLVNKVFTPRRVQAMEPAMRAIMTRLLDAIPDDGRCDLIQDIVGKFPMDVISDMIAVPVEDRDEVRGWADQVMHREEDMGAVVPPEASAASGKLLAYLRDLVIHLRKHPGDDLTSALLAAEVEGTRLSDDDVVSFLFLMSIAGNETTTKLLGNALYWAQRFPDQLVKVRGDWSLLPGWIEETLRFDNSSQILYRTLAQDVELHGQKLAKGDRVALMIGAANRDERVFENADVYDIERDCSNSLSFGRGIHFCLGANLARMEGRVCMDEIFARYSGYEIDEAACVRVHSGNVRGFINMPIQLHR
jgi:cytochrome P450